MQWSANIPHLKFAQNQKALQNVAQNVINAQINANVF